MVSRKVSGQKYNSIQRIRGIAILAIIISHLDLYNSNLNFAYFGAFGVSVFIMISGVLTGIRDPAKSNRGGVLARYKKFLPLHLLTFLLALILNLEYITLKLDFEQIIIAVTNIFCMQSWVPMKEYYFSYNSVSWYLSLVLFMEILMPWIGKWRKMSYKKDVIVLIGGVAVWNMAWYIFPNGYVHWLVYIFPIARIVEFLIGYMIGVRMAQNVLRENRKILNGLYMVSWTYILLLLVVSINVIDNSLFLTFVWFLPSTIIVSLAIYREQHNIGRKDCHIDFLKAIGDISMELFLTHQIVIRYVKRYLTETGVVVGGFTNIVCIVGIIISVPFVKKFEEKFNLEVKL